MTSSWYITRPVAGSGPVVAWRSRPAAPATPVVPEPEPAPTRAPRPPRSAFRTHGPRAARPSRRTHRHTTEAHA